MLKNYLKMAVKVLLRRKFFTFISLFGIAFTLIVLMVVVALFDHIFAPFPPEVNDERTLLSLRLNGRGPQALNYGPGYRLLDQFARNMPHVDATSFCTRTGMASSYIDGEKMEIYAKRTDGEFWRIFRFNFLEGAPFSKEDAESGRYVAVINQATRQKFFGERPAVGQMIEVDGEHFRICGVVANIPILRQIPFADIWIPIAATSDDSYKKEWIGGFVGVFMLRSKGDIPAVKAEFQSVLRNAESSQKEYTEITGELMTKFDFFSNQLFPSYYGWEAKNHSGTLLGLIILGMILFMALPAVNLVNINVSRILERASEIGVRKAFGASSLTLVGQFVIENILLSLVGGVLGLAGAHFILDAIERGGFVPYADFALNFRIFGYGFLLAVFFGLFSGIYPAWRMSRLHPSLALRGGAR
ncbi:MAG: ABC transporter permease [Acidobacteria bacterium]|nr:ABC transporter permease [Acidobacteriota bacterium]